MANEGAECINIHTLRPLIPYMNAPSWQARVINVLVRARMRPHAYKPIDPGFVRDHIGRPRSVRRLMFRASGAHAQRVLSDRAHPAGDWIAGRDSTDTSPVILYLHGGGYIACSSETHRPLVGSLTTRLNARAFVPDYRLAPEFPYPAALDDAVASYRFLLEQHHVPPSQLIIAGDSAGGGLALATAMRIRDEGLPQPAAILLFSPWTDMAVTGNSIDENSDRCAMFAGQTIRRAAPLYLGNAAANTPGASPLYGSFQGLAPLLIHASTDEVLRDDAVRVAERAAAAGVTVEFRLWPGVPHCWQFFAAIMPEAAESLQLMVKFVRKQLAVHHA